LTRVRVTFQPSLHPSISGGVMTSSIKSLAFAVLLLVGIPALERHAFAAQTAAPADLDKVLSKLDASAKTFQSAQADIVWDNVITQPSPDTDSQVGNVIFAHGKSGDTQVALHIKTDNGRPALKDLVYANGIGKIYQPNIKQMQVLKLGDNRSALDAFLTLGFGGSGADLRKTWKVSLAGTEAVNGIQASKLQLIPLDAKMAETTSKVFLWIDMDKGIAVKQQRFGTDGGYVVLTYSNIQLNGKVPSGAFDLKPPKDTQIVNH
jgi:outer membrane lipoprotein-sorting protein